MELQGWEKIYSEKVNRLDKFDENTTNQWMVILTHMPVFESAVIKLLKRDEKNLIVN